MAIRPVLICLVVSFCVPVAAEEISVSEIVRKWEATKPRHVRVKLTRTHSLSRDLPLLPNNLNPPKNKSLEYYFNYDSELGVRIDDEVFGMNQNWLFGDSTLTLTAPRALSEGVNTVIIHGKDPYQGLARLKITTVMLSWLDPSRTRWGTELVKQGGYLKSAAIENIGKAVEYQFDTSKVTLAETLDWRPVRIDSTAQRVGEDKYFFSRDTNNRLLLDRHSNKSQSGLGAVTIDRVIFEPVDVRIAIPRRSFVTDNTKEVEVKYLIRDDGTRRDILEAELNANKFSWHDLLNSNSGELLPKPKP